MLFSAALYFWSSVLSQLHSGDYLNFLLACAVQKGMRIELIQNRRRREEKLSRTRQKAGRDIGFRTRREKRDEAESRTRQWIQD